MSIEWNALIVSFVYVFAMIGIAEGLRKWLNYSTDFTRKVIHIAVGMWAYGTVLIFENWTSAIIPPAAFILINAISYRQETFKSMETGEKGRLGTIYFPFSFAILVWILWDHPHILVASLMPMTWGDALAAVIGGRIGRRKFSFLGSVRSLEGSITMFIASLAATLVPLLLIEPGAGNFGYAILASLLVSASATLLEAISPWGIDNLTVPAISAVVLSILLL
jgi:phytol kinase